MFHLYIFALLIHAAFSSTPCKDGVEIVSKETKNIDNIVGNWTYVYHWDSANKFSKDFDEQVNQSEDCPQIQMSVATPDFIKAKQSECSFTDNIPFKWTDAKLRVDAPRMKIKDGIITIGNKENWLMVDCSKMVRVIVKQVSEDYIVMVNPDVAHISEMLSKKIPTMDELKCVAHNADIGKGLEGLALCYNI